MSPFVTLYLGCPIIVEARVLFPEPLGPMIACISPCLTRKSTPFSISFPSMEACRSLISNWLNSCSFSLSLLYWIRAFLVWFCYKSGMTYVIFKGAKTAMRSCVSLFSTESRNHSPHLTASGNFSTLEENRSRVSFTAPCHFSHSSRVGESVTMKVASQLRPDYR